MHFILTDFVPLSPPVASLAYSAVECLRIVASQMDDVARWRPFAVTDEYLGIIQVSRAFAEDEDEENREDMVAACRLAGFIATILQEHIGGVRPSLPDRVFVQLRDYRSAHRDNARGVELCVIGLSMAWRLLREAADLHEELIDAGAADEVGELLRFAWESLELRSSSCSWKVAGDHDLGKIARALLA